MAFSGQVEIFLEVDYRNYFIDVADEPITEVEM
jgi:hypothetical protein